MNKRVNLRDITTSGSLGDFSTTYEGEYKKQIISAALLSGDTLDKGGVTIKPNVQYKEVIKKIDSGNILTSATCDFTPTADVIDIEERVLEVAEQQVNLEICKQDFVTDYMALEQGFSAYKNLPTSFADFIMAHVVAKVAEKTEQNVWGGVAATDGYDGLTTILAAATDVNEPTVTATEFTAANIIDQLGLVADEVPNTVYGKDDLKIYLPTVAYKAYVRALGGFGSVTNGGGANGVDNRGNLWFNGQELSFDGIPVFLAPGMPADHIVASEVSNLYFGTSLLSDHSMAKILDMANLDGSNNARVIMRLAAGTQVGVTADTVLYTLATA